jgi:hypothetical protein
MSMPLSSLSSLSPSSASEMFVTCKLVMMFCHNLFGGTPSLNIQNAIIGVWSFIILFAYQNNCCLINWPLPSSNLMCGQR